MSDGDSEEKTEQPTHHKLMNARKKGQVASSKDVVTATLTISVFIYFWIAWPAMFRNLENMVAVIATFVAQPFDQIVWPAIREILVIAAKMVIPVVIIVVAVAILTHIIILKGIVFSVHPIIPDFNKINFSSGFKKIFSRKSFIEFIKSLVKSAIVIAITYIILRIYLGELVLLSICDPGCTLDALGKVLVVFLATISIFFIIVGFLDYFLQEALFRHEMKMTKTEVKRENKDKEGDPLIKGHRRNLAREILMRDAMEGMHNASVALRGVGMVVGIRYIEGSTPLPVLVSKGKGQQSSELINVAMKQSITIHDAPGIVRDLFDSVAVGGMIDKQEMLEQIAPFIVKTPEQR